MEQEKEYQLAVTFEMASTVTVKAKSYEEALEKADDLDVDDFKPGAEYIDGSYQRNEQMNEFLIQKDPSINREIQTYYEK